MATARHSDTACCHSSARRPMPKQPPRAATSVKASTEHLIVTPQTTHNHTSTPEPPQTCARCVHKRSSFTTTESVNPKAICHPPYTRSDPHEQIHTSTSTRAHPTTQAIPLERVQPSLPPLCASDEVRSTELHMCSNKVRLLTTTSAGSSRATRMLVLTRAYSGDRACLNMSPSGSFRLIPTLSSEPSPPSSAPQNPFGSSLAETSRRALCQGRPLASRCQAPP